MILIDTPPLLSVTDASALAPADGRRDPGGQTGRHQVKRFAAISGTAAGGGCAHAGCSVERSSTKFPKIRLLLQPLLFEVFALL